MKIRLLTFLLLAAFAAPIVALVLRPYLVPRAMSRMSEMSRPGLLPPLRTVVVYEPGHNARKIRFAIVMPSTVMIGMSNEPASRHKPDAAVSVRRTEVYVDGKHWPIQHVPCVLVFDPFARTFEEVPIESPIPPFSSPEALANLPEWETGVVSILARIEAAVPQ